MVKKFTANCDFGGQTHPVTLYIGRPSPESHPLHFQSTWLSSNRGGSVPSSIMDSFQKIADIAIKRRVPFEDLCSYVIDEINSSDSLSKDAKQATECQDKKKKKSSASAKTAVKKSPQADENVENKKVAAPKQEIETTSEDEEDSDPSDVMI